MLNGIAPIMLFNFIKIPVSKDNSIAKIPVVTTVTSQTNFSILAPIPVYLDEKLTGLCIETESKNVDIETETVTLTDTTQDPQQNQRGLSSTVTITMKARRGSIGLTLLSALIDVVFKKTTAHEYSITYMHGAIIIFQGLLHGFEINENEDNDLS